MARVLLLRLVVMTVLIAASAGAKPASAASGNLKHESLHYAVTYPATWLRLPVKNADFAIIAPDHNAVFTVTVAHGQASQPALLDALKLVFAPLGRPTAPPNIYAVRYGRAVAAQSAAFVITPDGTRDYVTATVMSYRLRLYTIVGVIIDFGMRNQGADAVALTGMLASLTLT